VLGQVNAYFYMLTRHTIHIWRSENREYRVFVYKESTWWAS